MLDLEIQEIDLLIEQEKSEDLVAINVSILPPHDTSSSKNDKLFDTTKKSLMVSIREAKSGSLDQPNPVSVEAPNTGQSPTDRFSAPQNSIKSSLRSSLKS